MITRRNAMLGTAALSAADCLRRVWYPPAHAGALAERAAAVSDKVLAVTLDVAERLTALPCFNGHALPLWTFREGLNYPILRLKLGDRLDATVKNSLTRAGENITIHWHGLRIQNAEDGVPYMTQSPIAPGAEGHYSFVPPDTGTYFFHTHCNSVEHFGRGLVGALIVEGDEADASDQDLVLVMKDWRIAPDGGFLAFASNDGPAKSGTAGTVRSINGQTRPHFDVQAAGNVRLRILNVDATRICDLGIEGAKAAIIAVDGNACLPIPLTSWRFGPAQRLDILMRAPAAGQSATLVDYFAPEPVVLAEVNAAGEAKHTQAFTAPALRAGRAPAADLKTAERLTFDLSTTATGEAVAAAGSDNGIAIGALCLSKRTFWAINKQSWASADHADAGPPLAALMRGKSYIFEFRNLTAHAHPIHLHGHTFEVLSSSSRKLPPYRADTVLVLPKERIEVAFVADNPGRWMLHCHILEHQETGMMGYVTVS